MDELARASHESGFKSVQLFFPLLGFSALREIHVISVSEKVFCVNGFPGFIEDEINFLFGQSGERTFVQNSLLICFKVKIPAMEC